MRRALIAVIEAAAHQQIRWWSAVASWCRRVQAVNAFEPGHSKVERMRALDDEMVFVREKN